MPYGPHQTTFPTPSPGWTQFLEAVRYRGVYPTRARAEEAVRLVLAGLGRQLDGDHRAALAARLPAEAARLLTRETPDTTALTGQELVADLAARTGASLATTRWDTGSVLTVVAELAGPVLLERLLDRLPPGHALLFGRAELNQPAA
ncbi:uncharacterized protein (DUF2267 family) [Streptomyces sp. DSM 41037]|uniref:DUF2267 domain-containing protein n=1 Tax=Streptomyces TaxID=1883 RepID=UPI0027838AE3|nr:DUF2267 domain-containing protein [Streptomyces sp. DSM 41037]MDQ0292419.1 uncharacterized protein (DUF2267 family) [Streptomyces sp. DSM 41037]